MCVCLLPGMAELLIVLGFQSEQRGPGESRRSKAVLELVKGREKKQQQRIRRGTCNVASTYLPTFHLPYPRQILSNRR